MYEYTGDRKYLDAVATIADEIVARNQIATHAVWNDINQNKYCEGCGAVDWFLLNCELWQFTGDTRYLDRAETILYSALYYMQDHRGGFSCTAHQDTGRLWASLRDVAWCCTQKGAIGLCRAVQSCVASDETGVYVNFFMPMQVKVSVQGRPVTFRMDTDYPNTGKLAMTVIEAPDEEVCMRIRVPAWSALEGVRLNGQTMKQEPAGGYIAISRPWRKGDALEVELAVNVHLRKGLSGRVGEALEMAEENGEKQIEAAALYWGPVMLGLKSAEQPVKRYTLVVPSIKSASDPGILPTATLPASEKTVFSVPNAYLRVLLSRDGFPPPSERKLEPEDINQLPIVTLVPLSEVFTGEALGIFDVRSPADGNCIGMASRRLEEDQE